MNTALAADEPDRPAPTWMWLHLTTVAHPPLPAVGTGYAGANATEPITATYVDVTFRAPEATHG